jgi:hypothetical protein
LDELDFPVDVADAMGAEIIIAIDLANPLNPREELSTADKILGQSLQAVDVERKKKNGKIDLLIWPDMKGLSSTDYFFPDKMARILEQGEEAARKARPALQALKEKYGLLYAWDGRVITTYSDRSLYRRRAGFPSQEEPGPGVDLRAGVDEY